MVRAVWIFWLGLCAWSWGENQGTAVGDFNGDGKPDIVLIRNHDLLVFPGPRFLHPDKWPANAQLGPKARARVVDLGLDGEADILVLGPECSLWRKAQHQVWTAPDADWTDALMLDGRMVGLAHQRLMFYAMQAGEPRLERWLELPEEGWSLCMQDMDGDKKPDLVIGAVGSQDVLLVCSRQAYRTVRRYPMGAPVGRVVAGDFDGDGRPDLISVLEPEIRARPARGQDVAYPLHSVNAYDVIRADLNGDGLPDVALLARLGLRIFPGVRKWLLGTAAFNDIPDPDSLSAGDLNGDGRTDLVAGYAYDSHLLLLFNEGLRGLRKLELKFEF